jgi:mycothiol system anti-sigma-R factor
VNVNPAFAGQTGLAPIDCREALRQLYRYIDQEMALEELVHMRDHLDSCPDCHYEMVAAQSLRKLLRRSCVDPAPADLRARVAGRIAELRQGVAAAE